jgi:hypothetical protein
VTSRVLWGGTAHFRSALEAAPEAERQKILEQLDRSYLLAERAERRLSLWPALDLIGATVQARALYSHLLTAEELAPEEGVSPGLMPLRDSVRLSASVAVAVERAAGLKAEDWGGEFYNDERLAALRGPKKFR